MPIYLSFDYLLIPLLLHRSVQTSLLTFTPSLTHQVTPLPFHSFHYSFMQSFTHSLTPLLNQALLYPPTPLLIHLLNYSSIHSFIPSLIPLLLHTILYSFTHSFTPPHAPLFLHALFTHSLTHLLTPYSFTHFYFFTPSFRQKQKTLPLRLMFKLNSLVFLSILGIFFLSYILIILF